MRGVVLWGNKNIFAVETPDGKVYECAIKGKVLRTSKGYYNPLAPGDSVILDDEGNNLILDLEPRKNEFVRWNIKRRLPQVLASNLDFLVIVTSPCDPPFSPRFIDRSLAQAEFEKITPLIVLNKSDLTKEDEVLKRIADWNRIGYRVFMTSALNGEGITELSSFIAGKRSAFVGKSGAGKSSLINALSGGNAELRTGSISKKYGKGTHTTTKGSLLHLKLLDGTSDIIDTPGVKTFLLHGISSDNLALYFREFYPFIGKCGFGMRCTHLSEKDCAILSAVENGKISKERYESWKKTFFELKKGVWDN